MDHLAEQSALDLVAGHLGEPAAALAHAHLDGCGDCRALVAQLARTGIAGEDTRPVERVAAGSGGTEPTVAEGPAAKREETLPVERIDEYHVVALLGRGGMGSVYRARDTILDRDVALKLIARTGSELARQRFLTEARAVARIRHPNVVVVHRVGVTDDQPYIVYDLIRGKTFADLARPVPWPKALELAVGVTRGLAAAHACGVLHRDIKPANLMLDEHEDVVLVDFGLAKLGDDPDPARAPGDALAVSEGVAVTSTGVALGTPRYMAPEAWRGAAATPQTDLYSLGVVLHELLAGRVPFAETAAAGIARRVVLEDAAPLADVAPWVPAPLAALVDRCIQREPARRPASAAALGVELEDLQRARAFDAIERDRAARVPAGNPYPGARPFEWDEQGVLFGRRDELRALVDRVRERPIVVIAGDQGAGKSSLCRAGLLPLLFRGALGGARRWVPVTVVPGAHPVAALAAAIAPHVDAEAAALPALIARDPERVAALLRAGHTGSCSAHVLFVDPLDDLVTVADPEEAHQVARVIGALAAMASDRVRVVATVRPDRLLYLSRLPGLDAAIAPALQLVLPPTREAALREIVVEPARLTGRRVPDDTAQALVAAAAQGQLVLRDLSVRLAELWPGLPASEASEARRA